MASSPNHKQRLFSPQAPLGKELTTIFFISEARKKMTSSKNPLQDAAAPQCLSSGILELKCLD